MIFVEGAYMSRISVKSFHLEVDTILIIKSEDSKTYIDGEKN